MDAQLLVSLTNENEQRQLPVICMDHRRQVQRILKLGAQLRFNEVVKGREMALRPCMQLCGYKGEQSLRLQLKTKYIDPMNCDTSQCPISL